MGFSLTTFFDMPRMSMVSTTFDMSLYAIPASSATGTNITSLFFRFLRSTGHRCGHRRADTPSSLRPCRTSSSCIPRICLWVWFPLHAAPSSWNSYPVAQKLLYNFCAVWIEWKWNVIINLCIIEVKMKNPIPKLFLFPLTLPSPRRGEEKRSHLAISTKGGEGKTSNV